MSATAFALREDAKEDFAGASFTYGAARKNFDIGAALDDKEFGPKGTIVIAGSDSVTRVISRALKSHSLLKEVPVPKSAAKAAEKAEAEEQDGGDAA